MAHMTFSQYVETSDIEELLLMSMRDNGAVLPEDTKLNIRFVFQKPGKENERGNTMAITLTSSSIPETVFRPLELVDPVNQATGLRHDAPPPKR